MNRIIFSMLAGTAALLPAVFDSAVKGAILLSVAALAVLLMRRTSPAARHLVWFSGLAALLILPFLSATLPGWRILPDWTPPPSPVYSEHDASGPAPGTLPLPARLAEPAVPSAIGEATASAALPPERAGSAGFPSALGQPLRGTLSLWIGGIWAGVAALLFLRLIACSCWMRISMRRAEPVSEGSLVKALANARAQLGVGRRVRLLLDERRIVPLVWGVFRPRLVLPAEARAWDGSRVRSVMLHEMAHLKRHDLLTMLLTQLVCAVHWFNPLVWLAAWRMHVERERACDDLVLNSGVKASDYAEHLLEVATRLEGGRLPGALAMAHPSRLEGRLLAVLREGADRSGITRTLALAAICLAAGSVVPVAMLEAADKEKSLTQLTQAPAPGEEPAAESPPRESGSQTGSPGGTGFDHSTENRVRILEAELATARAKLELAEKQLAAEQHHLSQLQELHPENAEFETGPAEATVRLLEARMELLKAEAQLESANQEVSLSQQATPADRNIGGISKAAGAGQGSRSLKPEQVEKIKGILSERIELTKQLERDVQILHQTGAASTAELIEVKAERLALEQERAILEGDLSTAKQLLKARIDQLAELARIMGQEARSGNASPTDVIRIERDRLTLEMELAAIEGQQED